METPPLNQTHSPQDQVLFPGAEIGRLRIKRVLARGSSIVTYLAEDTHSDSLFFLEELFPLGIVTRAKDGVHVHTFTNTVSQFENMISVFLGKARRLTQIEASGAIQYGEGHGTAFLQREYEPGIPLPQLIQQQNTLNEYDCRQILESCSFLLQEMHETGIVHGDIQLNNILIRPDNDATLLGISTPGEVDIKHLSVESPYFDYAPVEALKENSDKSVGVDIYALGAVIYQCLCGNPPRVAKLRMNMLLSGGDDPVLPAESFRRQHFDATLFRMIAWMLKPLRADRPEKIKTVLESLLNETPTPDQQKKSDSTIPVWKGPLEFARDNKAIVFLPVAFLLFGILIWQFISFNDDQSDNVATVNGSEIALLESNGEVSEDIPSSADTGTQNSDLTPPNVIPASDSPTSEVALSRDDDAERAKAFREIERIEAEIAPIMAMAKKQMDEDKLIGPLGDNALESYRKILEIDNGNQQAKNAIGRIAESLINEAYDAFDDKDIDVATAKLDDAAVVDPTHRDITRLRQDIDKIKADKQEAEKLAAEEAARVLAEQEKAKTIEQLLSKADNSFSAFRIVTPFETSALRYYRDVLQLDTDNDAARDGIKRVMDYYLKRANQAIIDERFAAAESYLNTAESVESNGNAVNLLRTQLNDKRKMVQERERVNALTEQAATIARQQATQGTVSSDNNQATTQPQTTNTTTGDTQITQPSNAEKLAQSQAETLIANQQQIDLRAGLNAYYTSAYNEAFRLLNPLASAGLSRAQYRLGVMYLHGRGVPKNTATARLWFERALPGIQATASAGKAWAQADLGSIYEDGLIVQRDYQQAFRWYQRAAQQGYAGAQTNLGVMYASGLGVARNNQAAIQWFKQAADQGDRIAQENLQALGVNQ